MYIKTEEADYIDDEFGKIPIQYQATERIIRFLKTGTVKKGKFNRRAFYPYKYPASGECRLSVHRLDYSTLEHTRKIAIGIFGEHYRGIAILQIKHVLALNCDFETRPENGVTQHAHIIYPNYKYEPGTPTKTEITDIIEALYQHVKNHQLFFAEKMNELAEIVLPDEFPEIEG